ncbi:hypothetical protein PR048_028929 [Dryococelus australis]|uniref:Uncharacterized protein n=1 Tax=Dryococelus australis TaxID=614101 RepID=A0ABQ9GBX3_9NEOP|nr:hypothetical protein PR048_028929 [Dryococelus australis]
MVAERLDCLSPTKVNRVQSPAGSLWIFTSGNRDRRVFSGISRFPRSFIPALLHTHFTSPPSALKTSLLRAPSCLLLPEALPVRRSDDRTAARGPPSTPDESPPSREPCYCNETKACSYRRGHSNMVGIVPDDAAGRRGFSRGSPPPATGIPAPLHSRLVSSLSALETQANPRAALLVGVRHCGGRQLIAESQWRGHCRASARERGVGRVRLGVGIWGRGDGVNYACDLILRVDFNGVVSLALKLERLQLILTITTTARTYHLQAHFRLELWSPNGNDWNPTIPDLRGHDLGLPKFRVRKTPTDGSGRVFSGYSIQTPFHLTDYPGQLERQVYPAGGTSIFFRVNHDLASGWQQRRWNARLGETGDPGDNPRPDASSRTFLTCENPGAAPPGIETGLLCWEVSTLATEQPRPLRMFQGSFTGTRTCGTPGRVPYVGHAVEVMAPTVEGRTNRTVATTSSGANIKRVPQTLSTTDSRAGRPQAGDQETPDDGGSEAVLAHLSSVAREPNSGATVAQWVENPIGLSSSGGREPNSGAAVAQWVENPIMGPQYSSGDRDKPSKMCKNCSCREVSRRDSLRRRLKEFATQHCIIWLVEKHGSAGDTGSRTEVKEATLSVLTALPTHEQVYLEGVQSPEVEHTSSPTLPGLPNPLPPSSFPTPNAIPCIKLQGGQRHGRPCTWHPQNSSAIFSLGFLMHDLLVPFRSHSLAGSQHSRLTRVGGVVVQFRDSKVGICAAGVHTPPSTPSEGLPTAARDSWSSSNWGSLTRPSPRWDEMARR